MRGGFSLLEMMVAVFIVAILLAMSLPSFSAYFLRQNRLADVIDLTKIASAMEQYFLVNNTYAGASLEQFNLGEVTDNKRYIFKIVSASSDNFVVSAEPVKAQALDKQCATLGLDARGEKTISGTADVASCW